MPTYWVPLYTMTTFSPIPYHEVTEQSKNQDLIVKWTIPTLFATFLGMYKFLVKSKQFHIPSKLQSNFESAYSFVIKRKFL